jgi:hypothetical protein
MIVPECHWHRPAAHARRGHAGADAGLPVVIPALECDRCGKVQMISEAHAPWHDLRTVWPGCVGTAAMDGRAGPDY